MNEILQRWLSTRLGVIFDMDPLFFGVHVSDGILLARLLHGYDVIDAEQLQQIVTASDAGSRYLNLKLLHKWLEYIGVECDDSTLQEVANCVGSTAIRLFYQIFLCLENSDQAHFVDQKKKADCVSEMRSRFHVARVASLRGSGPLHSLATERNVLYRPFVERIDLIEKHKKKFEEIKRLCKENQIKFEKKLETGKYPELPNASDEVGRRSSLSEEMDQEIGDLHERLEGYEGDDKALDMTYSQLQMLSERVKAYDTSCGCVNVDRTKEFIAQLHKKSRKEAATRMFELQMQNLLAKELWRSVVDAQEQELDNLITKKLLKQSQYEKQMTMKLFQVRHEKKLVAENRALVEKLFIERRDQEFSDALDRERNEVAAERLMNAYEGDRNRELHAKLYAEKMQLRYEKHYDMCMDVMDALVDLTAKAADYREQNENVIPKKIWNEWKEIFIKNQPIFELVEDLEKIVDDEYAKEMEEIVLVEFGRQDVLNEHDLREYMRLTGPWALEELCPTLSSEAEVQNVLGFIVHRLLDLKYPLPPPPKAADLPPMTAAAIVVGVEDPDVIETLHQLLAKRQISVVLLEDAVNFCLQEFKKEMSVVRDIDLRLCRATKHTLDEINNSPVSKMSKKDKKAAKEAKTEKKEKKKTEKKLEKKKGKAGKGKKEKGEEMAAAEEAGVPHEEKETQTPRMIPDDDPLLSWTASLGQQAFDVLCMGEQIPDPLLIAMLVELLKSKTADMKGWVIFNYPSSYEQASLLEEALTGRRLPPLEPQEPETVEAIDELEERTVDEEVEQEECVTESEARVSRLVPNTLPPAASAEFRTYFTAYIAAKKADVEGELFEEVLVEEAGSPLEDAYTEQGMSYDFFYRTLDFPTVKQLAKLIVGDMQLPAKSSLELFGDVVLEVEEAFAQTQQQPRKTADSKKADGKVRKKEKKGKEAKKPLPETPPEEPLEEVVEEEVEAKKGKAKGKGAKDDKKKGKDKKEKPEKGGKKKGAGSKDDKKKNKGDDEQEEAEPMAVETQLEEQPTGVEAPVPTPSSEPTPTPTPTPARPGDDGWEYVCLELAAGAVRDALATMWENMEEVYVEDLKELFFLKRVYHAKVIPYLKHVEREITEFVRRPDTKQDHVFTFQIRYNEIDEELRPDLEMKNELYCRLAELRSLLWNMCDERRREAEVQRRMLIADDWVSEELCCLSNVMAIAMQLEVDRCADTLQLVNDYYLTMLQKELPESRLPKMFAARLHLDPGDLEQEGVVADNAAALGDTHTCVTSTKLSLELERDRGRRTKEFTKKLLTEVHSDNEVELKTPFHTFVADTMESLEAHVDKLTATQSDVMRKQRSIPPPKPQLKTKLKGKDKETALSEVAPAPVLATKELFDEWEAVLSNENARARTRLQLLSARAQTDLDQVIAAARKTFHRLCHDIESRYEREVASIDVLVKVFSNAIEEELPIQQECVLDQDTFFVREKVLLFPDPPPPPPLPIKERLAQTEFRIGDLLAFHQKMSSIVSAPYLPASAFVSILDDLITCRASEGEGVVLPAAWSVAIRDVPPIVAAIFGSTEYVDWKDFVVYAADVRYPTVLEVLLHREQFNRLDPQLTETVCYEDYKGVRLWFEESCVDDPQEALRVGLIKELLFAMFKVDDDRCHYTTLLLYFCKDEDPVVGFSKALTLALGLRVLITAEEYQGYQDDGLSDSASVAVRNAIYLAAEQLIDEVVDEVIAIVAGITIAEVLEEVPADAAAAAVGTRPVNAEWSAHVPVATPDDADADTTPTCPTSSERDLAVGDGGSLRSLLVENVELRAAECLDASYPSTPYLSFGTVLNLLTVAMPWQDWQARLESDSASLSAQLEAAFDELSPAGDPSRGRRVLAHELLRHPYLHALLHRVNKFRSVVLSDVVRQQVERSAGQ